MEMRNIRRVLYVHMTLFTCLFISCASPIPTEEDETALQAFAATLSKASNNEHWPISLTGSYKRSQEENLLVFRLTNLSKTPVTLLPSSLPWGNPHSIAVAAITTDGQQLTNRYPIADPPIFEKTITITPDQTITGEYDLDKSLEFSGAPNGKDILVLWTYRRYSDIKEEAHKYSGVVLIPGKN